MKEESKQGNRSFRLNDTFLRELRKRCGWSQEELAERTGLSDRSVRNAEAGKPIYLRSIRKLCDVFNQHLLWSLSPVQLFDVPPHDGRKIEAAEDVLNALLGVMFEESNILLLRDIVCDQIIYYCELGVLVGVNEVERRFSAFKVSSHIGRLEICGLSASGEYATASWALHPQDHSSASVAGTTRHGSICVRVKDGVIREAWDFPACSNQLVEPPSVPKSAASSGSVKLNSDLVRAKRLAAAMTQEDLAKRSGLSLRLIRTAENGNPVSVRSRELLAQALSLPLNAIEDHRGNRAAETLIGSRAKEYLEEIWNHENYAIIDTHLTGKFRFHHEMGVVSNRSEMKGRIQQFRKSFGEFDFNVTTTLDFGSFVVCKWRVHMTHIGTWLDVAPTGIRVTVNGASWVHVVGRQFGDAWDFWSPELILVQLRQAGKVLR